VQHPWGTISIDRISIMIAPVVTNVYLTRSSFRNYERASGATYKNCSDTDTVSMLAYRYIGLVYQRERDTRSNRARSVN
jgi:hypothetical protein